MSGGGSFGKSKSQQSSDPSSVWAQQSPYLTNLYSRAQDTSYGNQGQNYANQINQGAASGYGNMLQGGFQNQNLNQGLANFGNQQNMALGGAIQAGLGQINNNFNRNIMPGINSGSALTNTSGGSRQGIAQGLAASDANQQANNFVSQMMSNNFQNMMQNQLGAYGQMQQGVNAQNLSQMGAITQAPQLANLGFGSQYGDLAALQSLIGSPTVLGGGSRGDSSSYNMSGYGGVT